MRIFLKTFIFAKAQTCLANWYKKIHIRKVATILPIAMKRIGQKKACKLSYNKEGRNIAIAAKMT